MLNPEITLFVKEEIRNTIHRPENIKSIPLIMDRIEHITPVDLYIPELMMRGDVVKESILNGGKKVFILNQPIYRIYFDIEQVIEEFLSKKGCHVSLDQTSLWNRGLDMTLSLYPKLSGILKNYSGRTIQIEKGANIGTLFFKELQ